MVSAQSQKYYVAHQMELRFAEVLADNFDQAVRKAFKKWEIELSEGAQITPDFVETAPVVAALASDSVVQVISQVSDEAEMVDVLSELDSAKRFSVAESESTDL